LLEAKAPQTGSDCLHTSQLRAGHASILPPETDNVNRAMTEDDRIDNKRILMSPAVVKASKSGRRLQAMRIPSPRIQLALVAVMAVLSAALLGTSCPWGP
jgi:hypothetical protein